MKRILMLLAMALMPCLASLAQEYKYEARLGWIPVDVVNMLQMIGEDPSGETTWGPFRTVGIYSADFDVKVHKWISVGAKVNYRNSWRTMTKVEDGVAVNGLDRTEAMSLMPMAEFSTAYDNVFRCYANLGVGPGIYDNGERSRVYMAFQCTPIGIAIGNKISWYMELGLGNAFTGLFTGISWRF